MNSILHYWGISCQSRLFLNTPGHQYSVFAYVTESVPAAWAIMQFANATAVLPRAVTESGLCPIEVVLDADDFVAARDRLAVDVHQMLQNQDNRRFAFGFIVTETMVDMFDRSGAVSSLSVITTSSRNSFGR